MQEVKPRRKRRRRPTITPRFGPQSIALELGLIRMALDTEVLPQKKEQQKPGKLIQLP